MRMRIYSWCIYVNGQYAGAFEFRCAGYNAVKRARKGIAKAYKPLGSVSLGRVTSIPLK